MDKKYLLYRASKQIMYVHGLCVKHAIIDLNSYLHSVVLKMLYYALFYIITQCWNLFKGMVPKYKVSNINVWNKNYHLKPYNYKNSNISLRRLVLTYIQTHFLLFTSNLLLCERTILVIS